MILVQEPHWQTWRQQQCVGSQYWPYCLLWLGLCPVTVASIPHLTIGCNIVLQVWLFKINCHKMKLYILINLLILWNSNSKMVILYYDQIHLHKQKNWLKYLLRSCSCWSRLIFWFLIQICYFSGDTVIKCNKMKSFDHLIYILYGKVQSKIEWRINVWILHWILPLFMKLL